ncbi:putative RNA polymerase II Elongator complex associated protein Kti12 [Aspergillus stella-maris]|uniref:putative RNA polymerase II Elongator complex associated protein Kti12 n=1 Tax=Aspergillus stella-maris TaxID=1810926 RepID=UPI003CCD9EA8
MPLIVLTGYPCSGLTHRATQLARLLEETQSQLFPSDSDADASSTSTSTPQDASSTSKSKLKPSRYKIHVVSTHDNVNTPRTVYDVARTEKEARGIAYTRAKRLLGKDSFVILDGMNYIKGYRYQLWCEAKALGTSSCVVHVGTPIDQCVANNEARIAKKNASSAESKDEPKTETDEASNNTPSSNETEPKTEPGTEPNPDPYPPALQQNLIFRYEEPSMHSRWDKPLFTVPWADAEPPIAEIWTALTGIPHPSTLNATEEGDSVSTLTSSFDSTSLNPSSAASTTTTTPGGRGSLSTRPRVAIRPHQATVLPATADSSALYNMEKRTSSIIQTIRSFTLSNPSAKTALTSSVQSQRSKPTLDANGDILRQEEGITIPVPEASTPVFIPAHIALSSVSDDLAAAGGILALPRLQRLRRQWITLNRVYIAAPHAAGKGGGGLRGEDVGDAFVRFLNADFGDEVEGR